MKKILTAAVTFLFIGLSACNEFEVETQNPNTPLDISNNPELLLTTIEKEVVDRLVGDAWSDGNLMAQYSARIVFTAFDQFEWGDNQGLWQTLYRNIRNARTLTEIAEEKEISSYEAVSLILQSWMFQILTDLYGDIPYTQAVSAKGEEGVLQPEYDAQEVVYQGIIEDLKRANELLKQEGLTSIRGDIIYENDLLKWQKFANSLRMRAHLRLSNVKPQEAAAGIREIYQNPETFPVMERVEDNATLTYLASNPNTFPQSQASGYRVGSFNEYRMSETIEKVLKRLDDPRLNTWFSPTANSVENSNPQWAGMLNGVVDGVAYVYKGGDAFLSKWGDIFYFEPNTVEGLLMQYAEVEFILAEAAQRGWIEADAQKHYQNGIEASFNYWGVELPENYFNQEEVAYDGTLERIITQKWLGLLYNDYQGFIEFKRTGFPRDIEPGPDAFYDEYPSRYLYPTNEQATNNQNRQKAIQNMGASADQIITPVWWENK